MALAMSCSFLCISRFKECIVAHKRNGSRMTAMLDLSWRILLPIAFGVMSLIMPSQLFCVFIKNGDMVKRLSSIYLYTFVFCFFLSVFVLIKLGKIKAKPKLE